MKTATNVNMFEVATRTKLRFPSIKGELTIEQLWEVPLTSRDDFNLDKVARTVNKALKDASEESFVATSKSAAQVKLELALDIVKYVIQVHQDEAAEAASRASRKQKKEQLLAALAEKQKGELSDLSVRQLQKQIDDLEE